MTRTLKKRFLVDIRSQVKSNKGDLTSDLFFSVGIRLYRDVLRITLHRRW